MGNEDKHCCPNCNQEHVFSVTINYQHDIYILQVPPNHALRINTILHMYEEHEPRPVQPEPPPGLKVRVESTEISSSSEKVVVRHNIWIEEVPLNATTVDVHLYVKKKIPNNMRYPDALVVLEDGLLTESPRIGQKDVIEESFPFGNSQGQRRVDIIRNTRSSIDHRPTPPPRRPAKADRSHLLKELDALSKIVDWVDAVSRKYKCPTLADQNQNQ
ncbi:uncharacterized protein LOC124122821 [Haliotis rufescens]|uniref:uncharacterized protein LOC124122821 n=1 Tax=Haliotis rufescens TaxID=6454 RepID=UPI00201F8B5B|nr:uncharacterized protein LOC124122821 [Haliotis rufescens]